MVFFYISYLIAISIFCLPFSLRAKVHVGDKDQPLFITLNINRLFDIFPLDSKTIKKHKKHKKLPKISLKLTQASDMMRLLIIQELKIVCHNISKYNIIVYNIALVLLRQLVDVMSAYGNLYNFQFNSSDSYDNMPKLQIKLHIKINLFIIFSSFFKIIKINKRSKNNES